MKTTDTSQYDSFASDYHWLYSDRVLSGEPFIHEHAKLLASLPPDARILDCACGIGTFALALARHGYSVEASDASSRMTAEARKGAQKENVDIKFKTCGWRRLPSKFDSRFDVAFCGGNSIGHCRDEKEMTAALEGMHGVLKDGGLLVLNSRNWEKLRAERPRFHTLGVRYRDGRRCTPLYVWNFPRRWRDPHVIEVVLIFEEDGRVYHRSYPITYYPFRVQELLSRMRSVGFIHTETDYEKSKDGYKVSARRG